MDCSACPMDDKCVDYSEADKTCNQVLLQRLAEYEDSYMTPAEIKAQMVKKVDVIEADLSVDTIREIADEVMKKMRQGLTLHMI